MLGYYAIHKILKKRELKMLDILTCSNKVFLIAPLEIESPGRRPASAGRFFFTTNGVSHHPVPWVLSEKPLNSLVESNSGQVTIIWVRLF